MFELLAEDGAARRGELTLPHGKVQTPVFQAVGTYGTVKAMTPEDLRGTGTQMLLGNTFHLMLRPGDERIRDLGGLHEFIQKMLSLIAGIAGQVEKDFRFYE